MRFPDDRFTAIVLCNNATTNPTRLSRSLADIWLFDDTGAAVTEAEAVTATESISLSRTEMGQGELAELAGAYYSVELDATYEIVMANRLSMTSPNGADTQLTQAGIDEFATSGWKLVFDRDAAGVVTGFTMNAGRVRKLRFVRR